MKLTDQTASVSYLTNWHIRVASRDLRHAVGVGYFCNDVRVVGSESPQKLSGGSPVTIPETIAGHISVLVNLF